MRTSIFQSLVNVLYRYPKDYVRVINWYGGPRKYYNMRRQRQEMRMAAESMAPILSDPDGLPVHFLTGESYLHLTLFCIRSLVNNCTERFNFILVDDGTFNNKLIDLIYEKVPRATVVKAKQIELNLEKVIPRDRYPAIHHKRAIYGYLKKLTDIHTLPGAEWKIVFDSDMLFLKNPVEIINWLKQPSKNIYMQDIKTSYGYPAQLMRQICENDIPEKLNAGVVGLKSNAIEWSKIEKWIIELEAAGGTTFLLEQALTAMLTGNFNAVVLPKGTYIVNPSESEIKQKTGILQHFVDFSKRDYFTYAWKDILN